MAAGIFIVDVASLPLGVAAGVAYVGVVLIALWLSKWQHSLIVAGGVSVLTVLGFLLSEPAGIPWMVVANRLLALSAIWLTAIGGSWLVFTKRKKSEEALQKVEQEAERAKNAKSRFLETASNEVRQHLQTLSLLNGALRKTVTQAKAQEMFAIQSNALAHLSDLLNSLLEISEFESGEVEPKITRIPIQEIFQQLQDEFEYQAQAKDLQMEFNSQSAVALSDSVLLTRILRILVSNAIRYTNQGEVKVSCRREPAGLRITVRDSGIGIAPDQLARIFDEFYRVDNDPVTRDGGLGLGLAIVERSVSLLGTKMEVESEPGRGSSFSLVVPTAGIRECPDA
ncbi:MAG: HAMP domain-containing histidine kinase [Gammaproteobacteria bacterium]|nr:HAMP domain-containing histidine kinase [Gammaproteobacteria bacterium]